ncbi:MAG: hypothetical protein HGA33_07015 [Candidatus Moranbacteria bacterium]|nr:hypothetical protein [Candidatus Moranbacteria bacterium]
MKKKHNGKGNGGGSERDFSSEIAFLEGLKQAFEGADSVGHPKGKAAGNGHAKPDYKALAANCTTAAKALTEERYSDVDVPIADLIAWLSASKNKDFSMPNGEKLMFAKCIVQVLERISNRTTVVGTT